MEPIPITYRTKGGLSYLIGGAELKEDGIIECTINMRIVNSLKLTDEDNHNLRFSFVIPEE